MHCSSSILPLPTIRLDRFSRDQEDTAGLFKRLTFAGVNIVTLADGDITHLHIGFKGTMNLFLKDLAEKTHRGLRGRIEDGKSAGGLCYGYIQEATRCTRLSEQRFDLAQRAPASYPQPLSAQVLGIRKGLATWPPQVGKSASS